MAVSILGTIHQTVREDGATNPVTNAAGSNRLVIACAMMSDNASGGTLDTHTLNSTNFDADSSLGSAGSSSPYLKAAYSYFLDGNSPTTGTYALAISTTFSNSGTLIFELAGVDQTTPIVSGPSAQKGGGSSSSFPVVTVTCSDGDLVIYMVTTSNARTCTAPSALGGVDSWTEQITDDSGLVGGSLQSGYCWTTIASQDHTSETFNATLDDVDANRLSMCIVVAAAAAASGRIMSSLADGGGLAGAGGMAGNSGGLAG